MKTLTQQYTNAISFQVIGAAIEVYKAFGPGLLEKVYEPCLKHELELRGFSVTKQLHVPFEFKGIVLPAKLRFDLLVDDCVVVEVKAVKEILPIFEAQLLTYMRLLKKPKGVLLNFCCTNIYRNGQKTFVNEYYRALPFE